VDVTADVSKELGYSDKLNFQKTDIS
jgi:hypothetical protein